MSKIFRGMGNWVAGIDFCQSAQCWWMSAICWCTRRQIKQPLWKIWKSMGTIIPYIMENKKCSKPPTSWFMVDISILIGGIPTPLKNWIQWEGLSHILWKINMFQTTNQLVYGILIGGIPTPLKIWQSMGKIIPYIVENKHVPNHEPAGLW